MSEAQEQTALIKWAHIMENGKYPELKLLHAIPNGGFRNVREGRSLKLQGVRPGAPDLHLPVARGYFHSLWIEMKFGKNKLTHAQKEFINELRNENNFVAVCYSAEEAEDVITRYLEGKCSDGA